MGHLHNALVTSGFVVQILETEYNFIKNIQLRFINGDIRTYSYYKNENPDLMVGQIVYFLSYKMSFWSERFSAWIGTEMLHFKHPEQVKTLNYSLNNYQFFDIEINMTHPPRTVCKEQQHTHLDYDRTNKPISFFKVNEKYFIPFYGFHNAKGRSAHPALKDDELFGFYITTDNINNYDIDINEELGFDNPIHYDRQIGYYIELPLFLPELGPEI